MKIHDYLDEYCESNKAEFARLFNRKPQNVQLYFRRHKAYEMVITDHHHSIVHKIPFLENKFYTKNDDDKYIYSRKQLYKVVGEREL